VKQWNAIFQEVKENNCSNRIPLQVKISFKNEDDMNIFPFKEKLKKL
jgi:hypothetical protein